MLVQVLRLFLHHKLASTPNRTAVVASQPNHPQSKGTQLLTEKRCRRKKTKSDVKLVRNGAKIQVLIFFIK
jgi:hypothetical protein